MRYLKPEAPKCRAVDPAFRPSRAGKSLPGTVDGGINPHYPEATGAEIVSTVTFHYI